MKVYVLFPLYTERQRVFVCYFYVLCPLPNIWDYIVGEQCQPSKKKHNKYLKKRYIRRDMRKEKEEMEYVANISYVQSNKLILLQFVFFLNAENIKINWWNSC